MKFSIIIPVYNVEKYLANCLDSVLLQDFDHGDYEVIVVNDCSPDNSEAIVLDYQKRYSNLIYIKHEINKRQGGARNTALKIACGEYILFLDADDYWLYNNVLSFINSQLSLFPNTDVVFISNKGVSENYVYENKRFDVVPKVTDTTAFQYLSSNRYSSAAWNCCYMKSAIVENEIWFRENHIFEDSDWCLAAILPMKRMLITDFPAYGYRYNQNSVTNTPSVKHFRDNILGIKKSYEVIVGCVNLPNMVRKVCLNRILKHIFSWIRISRLYKLSESLSILNEVSNHPLMYSSNFDMTYSSKLKFWIMKKCPALMVVPYRIGFLVKNTLRKL